MTLHTWPTPERPREKLLSQGVNALSDAELLAILLRHGTKGRDVVTFARDLLQEYGGLRHFLEADYHRFINSHGLGKVKFTEFQSLLEITRRYLKQQLSNSNLLNNTQATCKFLIAQLRHQQREIFAVVFLNIQHEVITYEELFYGSLTSTAVHPREILKRCLLLNAHAVILSHNHPGGNAKPSSADRRLTNTLMKALSIIDVQMIDHIVIGHNACFSFREEREIRAC